MELLKIRTGIDVRHVPYKGVGPALQDTLAGHVMSMISNIPSSKPHIDKGTLRALAVTSRQTLAGAAGRADDVGGRREGLRGAELVRHVRAGRHAAADRRSPCRRRPRRCSPMPKTKQMLTAEGADPIASSPADFALFVRAEITEMGRGRQGGASADGVASRRIGFW